MLPTPGLIQSPKSFRSSESISRVISYTTRRPTVREICDASNSLTRDLLLQVVNAYFKYILRAIGIVKEYGAAHAFAVKNWKIFVSF